MTDEGSDNFPDAEHVRLALEAGRIGMWSWDASTNDVRWDAGMEACFGLEPGRFAQSFEDYVARLHPDDREAVVAAILEAQDRRHDLTFEHRVVWPDGTVHWLEARGRVVVDDDGNFTGMVGVGLDIDERKQLEQFFEEATTLRAHAELAQQLEDAQRIARIGSWRWDRASNQVFLSAEMRRQLDTDAALTGADLRRLLEERAHPDDAPLVRERQSRSTAQVEPFTFEHRIVVRGDVRHVVHRGEVLRDDTGDVVGLRGTTQDVTSQRRAEAALLATRERLARERHAVEVLHEALIRPEFPDVAGFEIAARYLSPEVGVEVGGDWYDAFLLPDGRMMLAVGDVSGHGIRAARLMAKMRHSTRAYATIDPEPGRVLERLDQFVKHFYEPEEFVTVQLAVLDPASGTLELVSAGHPPPVVVDADHAKFVDVDAARALGVSAAPLAARPLRFALDPGAALVLYTDGLVERRGAALRTLGDGVVNLLGLALPAAGASAEALCDMVIDACLRGVSRDDDVCVLALMAKER